MFTKQNVFLLLGSNKGNRLLCFDICKQLITQKIGKIVKISSVYETAAWGKQNQPNYYNQCLQIETYLSPFRLLNTLQKIEKILGRKNKNLNAIRTIDIDILFYNQSIINTKKLIVPHPRLHIRQFTLQPLNELESSYKHPIFNKSINELLKSCTDELEVRILPTNVV